MKLIAFMVAAMLSVSTSVQACTLFAAQGNVVADGGTLIAKNRDYRPGEQYIRYISKTAKTKYDFYALYGIDPVKNTKIMSSGINEKGLVVVVAKAGAIPRKQLDSMPRKSFVKGTLANCASVEEALKSSFLGPRFLLLADSKEIAYVEVGADGKTAVKRVKNGTLAHTNHYLEPDFKDLNIKPSESSLERYKRVTELLGISGKLFTMEDFMAITEDRNAGPDNSIWRVGSKPNISQTLSSFVVKLQKDGNFQLYLKYRPQPEDKDNETVLMLTRKDIFG